MSDPIEVLQKLQTVGLEYLGRYYGLYEAIVFDNDDPQTQGRIKVRVPSLGRDEPLELFAYPVSPFAGDGFGFFFPPEVGDRVWVVFQGGDPSLPLYMGGWWQNRTKATGASNIPPEARLSGPPRIRSLRTKAGHRIIIDEDVGITIQTPGGTIVRLNDSTTTVEIISTSEVKVQAQTAKVEASMVDVNASDVNVRGSNIRINNGTKFAAAIGDGDSNGDTITGPPSGGRPLIP